MGKKPSDKKPEKKAPAKKVPPPKAVPKKPKANAIVKSKPKIKPMEKVEAVMPTKVPDWLVPPPPPIDHDTLGRRARSLRLHLMAARKRLGVVSEGSKAWVRVGARHLDDAIQHIAEFPGLEPFVGEMLLFGCLDAQTEAVEFTNTLADDIVELLERAETAPDHKDFETFYMNAGLALNSVLLDLERFDGEDVKPDDEATPVPALMPDSACADGCSDCKGDCAVPEKA